MSDDSDIARPAPPVRPAPPTERVSRFREHTNTNSSIRAPPLELWREIGAEGLMDGFVDENEKPGARQDGHGQQHPRRLMERSTTMTTTMMTKTPTPTATTTTTTMMMPDGTVRERRIAQPRAARNGSHGAATVATGEGTFGRFSRVFASVFGGVLGKRKAEHADAEPLSYSSSSPYSSAAATTTTSSPTTTTSTSTSTTPHQTLLDDRKRAAEEAYHLAKAQGLLPAPKVFVRPGMVPRAWSADPDAVTSTSTATPATSTTPTAAPLSPAKWSATATPAATATPSRPYRPRTPGSVARSPSKVDLHRQKRLSRRVSCLEEKLATAKRELASVLGAECFPAVPPLPGQYLQVHAGGVGVGNDSVGVGNDSVGVGNDSVGVGGGGGGAGHHAVSSDDVLMLSPTLHPHAHPHTHTHNDPPTASLPAKLIKKRKSAIVVTTPDTDVDEAALLPFPTHTLSQSHTHTQQHAPADVHMADMTDAADTADASSTPHTPATPPRQHSLHRATSTATKRLKRTGSRLSRKVSRGSVGGRDREREREHNSGHGHGHDTRSEGDGTAYQQVGTQQEGYKENGESEVVVIVRPGGGVPPVPKVPGGVEGVRVRVGVGVGVGVKGGVKGVDDDDGHDDGPDNNDDDDDDDDDNHDRNAFDDGYGGLGHEIF